MGQGRLEGGEMEQFGEEEQKDGEGGREGERKN